MLKLKTAILLSFPALVLGQLFWSHFFDPACMDIYLPNLGTFLGCINRHATVKKNMFEK